jgi:hypothetical protein
MGIEDEGLKTIISVLLLVFLVVVAIYMWSVDLVAYQGVFAVLLSAEMIAFSMLIYVCIEPGYNRANKSWLAIGYFTLALLLSTSIAVSQTTETETPRISQIGTSAVTTTLGTTSTETSTTSSITTTSQAKTSSSGTVVTEHATGPTTRTTSTSNSTIITSGTTSNKTQQTITSTIASQAGTSETVSGPTSTTTKIGR